MTELPDLMCPHCGALCGVGDDGLTPYHDWPKPTRQICPGSKQNPRCGTSDARPLWNGQPNPHFDRWPAGEDEPFIQSQYRTGEFDGSGPDEDDEQVVDAGPWHPGDEISPTERVGYQRRVE